MGGYLNRLYALSFRLHNGEADLLRNNDGSGLLDSLVQIRSNSMDTVEAIEEWRSSIDGGQNPTPFIWKGQNYLLKMTSDLDFLAMIKPLVAVLGIDPVQMRMNPFMSALTLEELHEKLEEPETEEEEQLSPDQIRVRNAEHVLIREFAEQDKNLSSGALQASQIDAGQLQHTAEVLQWHSHAERQLEALRQPLAEPQMGRTSTNRLYVPKRGGPMLQPLQAPQPQTLRDLMRKKDYDGGAEKQPSVPEAILEAVGKNNCIGYIPDFEEYEFLKKRALKDKKKKKKKAESRRQPDMQYYEQQQRSVVNSTTKGRVAASAPQSGVSAGASTSTVGTEDGEKPKMSKAERQKARAAQKLRNVQATLQLPLRDITVDYIKEMADVEQPAQVVALVAATVLILLVPGDSVPTDLSWTAVRTELANGRKFLRRLRNFDPSSVAQFKIRALQPFISNPSFNPDILQPVSVPAAALAGWVLAVINSLPDYKAWLEQKARED